MVWLSRFCAERLQSLIRTLDLHRLDEYASLQKVASFATLVATYEKGRFLFKSKSSPLICHLLRLPPYSWTLWNGQRDCPKSSISSHVRLSSLRWTGFKLLLTDAWILLLPSNPFSSASVVLLLHPELFHLWTCTQKCCSLPRSFKRATPWR